MAEGGGLLNRYTLVKAYRGFESLRLRHWHYPLRLTKAPADLVVAREHLPLRAGRARRKFSPPGQR